MSTSTRDGWADTAKGLCIVLVVLWHVVAKHAANVDWGDSEGIAAWWALLSAQFLPLRMPLFFFISGLFAARAVFAPDGSSAARRVGRLFGLYALWLTIQTFALAAAPDFETARARDFAEFLAQLTFSPTNLWYFLALGVYLLIARATRKAPTAVVLAAAFAVSAVAAAGVLPDWGNFWQVVQNLFFFLAGLRLGDRAKRMAGAATLTATVSAAAAFGVGLVAVSVLGARQWFGVWPLLCAVSVVFGLLGCAMLDRYLPRATRPLRWIGQKTLPIYVLHMIPLALIDRALRSDGAAGALANPVMAVSEPILLTALVILVCLAVHGLMVRCGLKVLFDPLLVLPKAPAREPSRAGR
ncbi:acyltransferase family protein [Salininema proteolyticum]|uniref:Acyltransferase family protein n=1 Tax=Salininema proteolyticum TaxID=1607685 RepID=A0ABV8TXL6_9ACTN